MNYDSHLTMQELGKFNLTGNVIPNGLEKHMSFNIKNQLIFINSFQFLSSLLDSLVTTLNKDNFKYLSQKFDNVLVLVMRNRFYPYEYMSDFGKVEEELPSKEKFYSSLTGKKISGKVYEHVFMVWNKFEMKTKDYHNLYRKI